MSKEATAAAKEQPTAAVSAAKPTTASKSFERVGPEWIPLHVAMMRFFPAYAPTGKLFFEEVKRLVTTLDGRGYSFVEDATYVVRIVRPNADVVVDGARGEIEIVVTDDNLADGFFFVRDRVRRLSRKLPVGADRADIRDAVDLASKIGAFLIAAFQRAVNDGSAELYGRWHDLKAPFDPVYPDHWHRLTEAFGAECSPGTDLSTYTVDGCRGDLTIYSVHVRPHRKQQSASNRASIACQTFFVDQIKQIKGTTERVIVNDLKISARNQWPRNELSDGEINRCLASAISETNSNALVRRGRPKKI